jgi:hypothetical protein
MIKSTDKNWNEGKERWRPFFASLQDGMMHHNMK